MADLKRLWRWERYEPMLGENRELEPKRRFWLKVRSGMSKQALQDFTRRYDALSDKPTAADRLAAFTDVDGPLVEMGAEPLTVQGKSYPDLASYFELAEEVAGHRPITELLRAVFTVNSVEGPAELFSGRLAGGAVFTLCGSKEQAAR